MRIQKINDEQIKIENSVKGLETLDIFDIVEDSPEAGFVVDEGGLACLKYEEACCGFGDSHFDSLIGCSSVVLNKIEGVG